MYDHFIALDWAQENMAIARMTKTSKEIKVIDVPSDLDNLKAYLSNLRGKKILTLEETTTAHWLFVELSEFVDEVLVCDPYRNRLLSEGPKTDRIDARKLVQLLRAGLLKPVYHSHHKFIELRKLASGYNDLVQRGVRLKNQRSALLRAKGKAKTESLSGGIDGFVLKNMERAISEYQEEKDRYEQEFKKQVKAHTILRYIHQIPGIGYIGAVKLGAIIVTSDRFAHRNNFHSYCGLVRLKKMSGGRSYGSKLSRHSRLLKSVFKTAALNATENENCFTPYYNYLIKKKRYPDFQARHAVARLISTSVFGVMSTKKRFNPKNIGALNALDT